MELELVTIGNELLLGYTVNTNAADAARVLADAGVTVRRAVTVGDDGAEIGTAIREALRRTGFVIATGGLGPTKDDITKRAVADLFGVPLELDADYLQTLRARFDRLGRGPMPESNRSQAEVPRGATSLPNPRGTAPGIWMEGDEGTVVLLPGVPREMRGLIRSQVIPRLAAVRGEHPRHVTRSRVLRTTGIAESALAVQLEGVEAELKPLTLAYLPGLEGVDLRVTAWNLPEDRADSALAEAVAVVGPLLGPALYGHDGDDLATVLLRLLGDRGLRLGVAESCTGGLVGRRLTAHDGASAVFAGSVVAYENAVKESLLGVPAETLEAMGAVSEDVVLSMVRGAAERLGTDAGIAVTGIAGPGGGTPDKPVGTVWLAACLGRRDRTVKVVLPGGRNDVRERAAQASMDLLRRLLLS